MPRGAAPGERRGGRKKGTLDKATVEKQDAFNRAAAAALSLLDPKVVKSLTPANLMRLCMTAAAEAGLMNAALVIAEKCAPYFDPKLGAVDVTKSDTKTVVVVRGGFGDPVSTPVSGEPVQPDATGNQPPSAAP